MIKAKEIMFAIIKESKLLTIQREVKSNDMFVAIATKKLFERLDEMDEKIEEIGKKVS